MAECDAVRRTGDLECACCRCNGDDTSDSRERTRLDTPPPPPPSSCTRLRRWYRRLRNDDALIEVRDMSEAVDSSSRTPFDAVLSSAEQMDFGIAEGYEPAIQLRLPRRTRLPRAGWGRRPTQVLEPRTRENR